MNSRDLSIPKIERENCSFSERFYYASGASSGELFITPTFMGHYVCKQGYRIDRATSVGSCLILLTLSGRGRLHYRERSFEPEPGTVMLLDCASHQIYHVAEEEWEFKYIHFEGSLSLKFTNRIIERFAPVLKPSGRVFDELRERVDRVTELTRAEHNASDAKFSSELYAMLMLLLDESSYSPDDLELAPISEAVEYIRNHYFEPIGVSDIADALYMSRVYFSVSFKRTYGISPHRYLTEYRMRQAKKLLAETRLTVSAIALTVGFSDQSVFARTFARHEGLTPSEYRRTCGGF